MIRRATPADAAPLAELHRASILALCHNDYSREQLAAWTGLLAPPVYDTLMRERQVCVHETSGVLNGLGVCDERQSFIHATYVHPSAARRGIGRLLMSHMESLLLGAQQREISLNATLNAVSFYRALGYLELGHAVNRLPSGEELACVLMKKLPGA